MKRPYPRILFAAPSSGSGKTTLVCGVLKTLLNRGMTCAAFKCGPDYIDPMFHKYVLGISGSNLDSFFLEPGQVRDLFCRRAGQADISVVEGVMGYYDGLAGISTRASTYDLGKILDCPVVLVVDGRKSSLSIAAVIKGFLEYQEGHQICGVILNRVGGGMAERLRPPIEELGVELLGYIPQSDVFSLESRHLGLKMPGETDHLKEKMEEMADILKNSLNIDRILKIAGAASWMEEPVALERGNKSIRIGVARDEAFCFYYQENLELLEALGAELVSFSPLHDSGLPEGVKGLLLGGGYPEIYADQLSGNVRMRRKLLRALKDGMPLMAECGGFLYLHDRLQGADGSFQAMVGYIGGDAYQTDKLKRFGYVQLERREEPKPKEWIRGHEFHYWESQNPGDAFFALKPLSDTGWNCIHAFPGQILGFPHLYYPSNPDMIKKWLSFCGSGKEG